VKPSIEGLRHLRRQGWTYKRIAEEYGLSEGEVYMMLSGGTGGKPLR
jgi:response regulator RpfG family c-di-GMP phosphodiesterase